MDIRYHTRFRRDIPTRSGKRNGYQRDETLVSGIVSDLGARLATFKASVISHDSILKSPRPLFIGACDLCTPHSKGTLGSEKVTALLGLENVFSYPSKKKDSKVLLRDEEDKNKPYSYHDEKEFQLNVISPKRRYIERVLALNTHYNSSDITHWFNLMQLKLCTLVGFWKKIRQLITNWLMRRVFPLGIIYHPGQIAVIKRSLLSEMPLVFLSLSQSSMDSAVIQRVLSYDFNLPTITIKRNENTHSTPLSMLERFQEAFSNGQVTLLPENELFASDLVWSVQQEVIQSLLENGSNLIFSMDSYKANEETVKRWKQCQLLSSLVEVLESNESSVKDINIVPMSVTYDLKFEDAFGYKRDRSLIKYLCKLGKFLWSIFNPSSQNCGRVRIDFDQPFSLLEFMSNTTKNTTSSEYNVDSITLNLHNHVLWNSFNLRRFSACDIYSFIKNSSYKGEVVHTFEKVIKDIKSKHRDIAFSGDSLSAVKYVSKFRLSSTKDHNLAANVIQIYLGEMVMATAICSLLKTHAIHCYQGTHAQIIVGSKQNILDQSTVLLSLVEYEFPFITKPCKDGVENFLTEAFDSFTVNGMIIDEEIELQNMGSQHIQARKSRQMAKHLDLDDHAEWEQGPSSRSRIKIGLQKDSISQLFFYKNQFVPFLSSYIKVVEKLKYIIDIEYVSLREFMQYFSNVPDQEFSRIPVILSRFEAMKVFKSAVTDYKGEKSTRVMWLTEEWNSEIVLNSLSYHICRYTDWQAIKTTLC